MEQKKMRIYLEVDGVSVEVPKDGSVLVFRDGQDGGTVVAGDASLDMLVQTIPVALGGLAFRMVRQAVEAVDGPLQERKKEHIIRNLTMATVERFCRRFRDTAETGGGMSADIIREGRAS